MSAWGPGLYQDDVANDVKLIYRERLREDNNGDAAFQAVFWQLGRLTDEPDDGPIFWFALADTMWRCGRLTDEVREKALFHLDNGTDLARWQRENPPLAPKREAVLNELRKRLLSPQKPPTKQRTPRLYTCPWQIGDVYAYPLDSGEAVSRGLSGCSLLFHKVGTASYHPGHICPVVMVKIVRSDCPPLDAETFAKLPCLRVFGPGMYRLRLMNTSKRITPGKLQFIGSFPDIPDIPGECIPRYDVEYPGFLWKWFDKHLLNILVTHTGLETLLKYADIPMKTHDIKEEHL